MSLKDILGKVSAEEMEKTKAHLMAMEALSEKTIALEAKMKKTLEEEEIAYTPPEEVPKSKRQLFPEFFRFANGLKTGIIDFKKHGDGYARNPDGSVVVDVTEETDGNGRIIRKSAPRMVVEQVEQVNCPMEDANVVSSEHRYKPGMHRVVLDLDMDAVLIPSSTKGHHHLIINKMMPWEKYEKLLSALADAGIIEKGYYEASKAKKGTWIRTPWTKKEVLFADGGTIRTTLKSVEGIAEIFNMTSKAPNTYTLPGFLGFSSLGLYQGDPWQSSFASGTKDIALDDYQHLNKGVQSVSMDASVNGVVVKFHPVQGDGGYGIKLVVPQEKFYEMWQSGQFGIAYHNHAQEMAIKHKKDQGEFIAKLLDKKGKKKK